MAFARVQRQLRKRKHRKRARLCDQCHVTFARHELIDVDGRALCSACAAEHERPVVPLDIPSGRGLAPPLSGILGQEGATRHDPTLHERLDAWLSWGFLGLRCAFYLVMFLVARKDPLVQHACKGFILADIVAWGLRAFYDLRHARLAVLIEFLVYLGVVRLFYEVPGVLELPSRMDDRATVALAFMCVFTFRIVGLVLHVRFGERGDRGERDRLPLDR